MSRTLEKKLTFWCGIWQMVDGIITIIGYGTYIKIIGSRNGNILNYANARALSSVFGSMYIFLVIFGTILIGLGLLNLYFSKTYLENNKITYVVPICLLIEAILAYFCMDLITTILMGIAGIVALSKNKAIKSLNNN